MAKKKTGTALVAWDEELANFAKEAAAGAKVSGEGNKFISFKNGMSFQGEEIEDDELRCVIVGWTRHNTYYDPKIGYDPENPQTPICYSFGQKEEEMVPEEASPDVQCGDCASCPFNQFESAKGGKGKGKACKNTIRLALIAETDLDDLDNAEIVYASIPPKSIKNWNNYLAKDLLGKAKRPPWSVITLIKRKPDSKAQFLIEFSNEDLIEDQDLFGPIKDMWDTAMSGITFGYNPRRDEDEDEDEEEEEAPKPKKKQKFSGRR